MTEAAEAKFRASKRLRLWSLLSLLEPRGIRGSSRLARDKYLQPVKDPTGHVHDGGRDRDAKLC